MRPAIKEIREVHDKISLGIAARSLSLADVARLSNVDPSQVSRICKGQFKTFSFNVMQVCNALNIVVPRIGIDMAVMDTEWAQAQASLLKIRDHVPEGAKMLRRVLDAIADLQATTAHAGSEVKERDLK